MDIPTIDNIRNGLISKIMTIRNKDFLIALDSLISSSEAVTKEIELSTEQYEMLELSDADIQNNELIPQDAMDKRNLEWLDGL